MPGSTRTITKGQAVYWSTVGGVTTLLPWFNGFGSVIAGFSTSPDVTFPLAGPYPSIEMQSEGALSVPGASFTPDIAVYLDGAGLPTQGVSYGGAAIASQCNIEIGIARSSTSVDLCVQHGFKRAGSGVRPLIFNDTDALYPQGPANVAQQAELRKYLGLGSEIGVGRGPNPTGLGDVMVEATSNTTLTFKMTGSDSVTRTATLTLS